MSGFVDILLHFMCNIVWRQILTLSLTSGGNMPTGAYVYVLHSEGKGFCNSRFYFTETLNKDKAAYIRRAAKRTIGDNAVSRVDMFPNHFLVKWRFAKLPAELREKSRAEQVDAIQQMMVEAINDCFGTKLRPVHVLYNMHELNDAQERHKMNWTSAAALNF